VRRVADTIRFVQARHYRKGRIRPIRLVIIHDMESPEKTGTAEAVAAYFARTDREASAHYNVDADSIVQSVRDGDTAFAAKGANADGLHIEHAGYASQKRRDWTDPYSARMLARSARLVARLCLRYRIPVQRLTPDQVRLGGRGLCGHADVTKAYPPGSGHTDPGPGFPWPDYLKMVQAEVAALQGHAWTRTKVRRAAAGLGVGGAVLLAGVTQIPDPKPVPKPVPSRSTPAAATSKASSRPATTTRPVSTASRPPTARPRITVTATRTVRVTATRTVVRRYVLVRSGDTLTSLAQRVGVKVADLRRLNPSIRPQSLAVGTLVRYA
jgi:N-acetyl-anhydromuramyl-L-alanine amidase AmpD/LysM repeat protein